MRVFVRTLLVWLMVLALPVQGAAAASMAFCGPDHHGDGSAGLVVTSAVSGHSHHSGADVAHGFEVVASAEAAVADDPSAMLKAGQAAKQKCSVCAACCSLGAILGTVPVVPMTDSAPTVFTIVVPTVDTFAADGPDRPPRSVLV
ncbi:hypothetical protein [Pseudaquabacterium pictum]|uniref:Uncharacterized protein n=1 Tax=Pseudaquabacterium pictum TaxID=2315236 RepID=A0A480AV80_9BURK|nr:hypothetical protein [Rubrivivax pictus]GCL63695.1 hypothetical protein AQPW35_27760 [Rubrivivax pictus]